MDANVEAVVEPTCWIIAGPNGAGKLDFRLVRSQAKRVATSSIDMFLFSCFNAVGLSAYAQDLCQRHGSEIYFFRDCRFRTAFSNLFYETAVLATQDPSIC